jgi:MFS family permease
MNNVASIESHPNANIQWKQLWSLAALYGSIVIGWIAYHNYQPKLLEKFHFTDFTFLLTVVQGLILVITPPIAGKIGDRFRFKHGHRLPIITSGMSFAAMVFMSVAFTLLSNPGEIFKWILPILIVLWLVSMSIFTSPALSTLELFTPVEKLPSAMAVITIVGNLIYALEPVIVDIIDYLGAPLTFITGGVIVFLSGYALKKNSLTLFTQGDGSPKPSVTASVKSNYGYIFIMGAALGLATTILFHILPPLLENKLSWIAAIEGKWMIVGIMIVAAAFSLPAGEWTNKYGMSTVLLFSLVAILISTVGILALGGGFLTAIWAVIFAVGYAALSVSSLPLAILKANYYEKVFCVGVFFSGTELPAAIMEAISNY